jgi:adenosylmethionine-8-amino-7-oxononanoate aminotransferase
VTLAYGPGVSDQGATASTELRKAIVEADKRHVWRPYTPMEAWIATGDPLVIASARGARLFDVDGRSYLDANASWWVATLGHNHPRLIEALTRQAERACHVALAGMAHEPAAMLGAELVQVAPKGLDRVFYSDDGSTALECALKMTMKLHVNEGRTERTRFVSIAGAFHGETLGVTALGGVELFRRPFDAALMSCHRAAPPDDASDEATARALAELEALFDALGGEIAGVVVEPMIQGVTGMRMHGASWLRGLRALCDRHGALLIADEVFTGYGRTGAFWAVDHAGITPDILAIAKGFTSGILPMAATLATARVFDAFLGEPSRALHVGHSYCGHALGCAVAREVLRVFRDEQVMEGVPERAARIQASFARMGALPGTKNARAMGIVGAIDLADDAHYLGSAGWRVFEAARRRGIYLRPLGDVVYVTPPINIALNDLDELLSGVEASVAEVVAP